MVAAPMPGAAAVMAANLAGDLLLRLRLAASGLPRDLAAEIKLRALGVMIEAVAFEHQHDVDMRAALAALHHRGLAALPPVAADAMALAKGAR